MQNLKRTWQDEGVRGILKRYKWKVILPLLAYYLIRDITLYLILPYLIFKTV